jgi:hypothetical protein
VQVSFSARASAPAAMFAITGNQSFRKSWLAVVSSRTASRICSPPSLISSSTDLAEVRLYWDSVPTHSQSTILLEGMGFFFQDSLRRWNARQRFAVSLFTFACVLEWSYIKTENFESGRKVSSFTCLSTRAKQHQELQGMYSRYFALFPFPFQQKRTPYHILWRHEINTRSARAFLDQEC